MAVTDREIIEARCESQGLVIEPWDEEHENGLTAIIEGRFIVVEGDDEGVLEACVVSSEQYRNRRVSFALLMDEYDQATEVPDLSMIDRCDV